MPAGAVGDTAEEPPISLLYRLAGRLSAHRSLAVINSKANALHEEEVRIMIGERTAEDIKINTAPLFRDPGR